MAVIYQDTPPQYFPQPFQNNSVNAIGYYVTVSEDGTTTIFRKGKNALNQEETVTIGTINKGENFKNTTNSSREEIQYFSANGRKIVTEQAVPVVRRGIGGQAGGGNTKINEILGTNLQTGTLSGTPGGSAAPPDPIPNAPVPINNPEIKTEGVRETYNNYYYPESLRGNQNKQDIIRFTAFSYGGRSLTLGKDNKSSQTSFGTPGLGARNLKKLNGSVTLPIQPSITDTNTVQWGSEDLNALQAFGAAVSYGAQSNIAGAAQQTMNAVEELAKTSGGNMSQAFRIYLAGKAVGVNGLLSRIGGGVLNPNMELLFQGPQLRPFNFTFRLSPRDEKEAQQVKYIIRFFKENMSVQNTADDIFLKAPNVFQINYLIRGEKDHPSLNRIKVCALQSCSVDYTPDGSYMTFNDENATMTSYNLTLQFQELEPVTAKDYTSNGYNQGDLSYTKVNLNEIGY